MEHEHTTTERNASESSMDHGSPAPKTQTIQRLATKPLVIGLVTGVAVVVLTGVLASGVALYNFGWESPLAESVVHAVPFPAAIVNGKRVSYADYLDDLRTVRHFFVKQKEQGQNTEIPAEGDLRKGVLDRLIQTRILEVAAEAHDVTVTSADTQAEFDKLAGGKTDAVAQIKDLYGWTPEEFQLNVIRPYLLEQKLSAALATDPAVGGAAEKEAQDVLNKATSGDDFATLAKDHSKDPGSAQNGGELGWFGKGVMVPEFEAAAFALKPGEISSLVKTQFGWHIIKVEEVKKDKKGDVTEVRAAHVLISAPSVTDYLKAMFDEANIVRFVSGLSPEKTEVVAPTDVPAGGDVPAPEPAAN